MIEKKTGPRRPRAVAEPSLPGNATIWPHERHVICGGSDEATWRSSSRRVDAGVSAVEQHLCRGTVVADRIGDEDDTSAGSGISCAVSDPSALSHRPGTRSEHEWG